MRQHTWRLKIAPNFSALCKRPGSLGRRGGIVQAGPVPTDVPSSRALAQLKPAGLPPKLPWMKAKASDAGGPGPQQGMASWASAAPSCSPARGQGASCVPTTEPGCSADPAPSSEGHRPGAARPGPLPPPCPSPVPCVCVRHLVTMSATCTPLVYTFPAMFPCPQHFPPCQAHIKVSINVLNI